MAPRLMAPSYTHLPPSYVESLDRLRPAGAGVAQPGASAPGTGAARFPSPEGPTDPALVRPGLRERLCRPSGTWTGEGARFPGLTPRAGQLPPLQGEDDRATHRNLAENVYKRLARRRDAPQIPSNQEAPPGSPAVLAGSGSSLGSASRSHQDSVVKEHSSRSTSSCPQSCAEGDRQSILCASDVKPSEKEPLSRKDRGMPRRGV